MEHGVRLGWLIQPARCCVHIFRPDAPVEVLQAGAALSGNAVLPGLILPLDELFGWLYED